MRVRPACGQRQGGCRSFHCVRSIMRCSQHRLDDSHALRDEGLGTVPRHTDWRCQYVSLGGCSVHHTCWIHLLKTSGTCCSGITPAQDAGGPGSKAQRVHCLSRTHGASCPRQSTQEVHRYLAHIICRCEIQQRHLTCISIDQTAYLRTSGQTTHMLISITRVFISIQILYGRITTNVW